MREFRGLRIDGGGWVYGFYLKTGTTSMILNPQTPIDWIDGRRVKLSTWERVIPETVGQCIIVNKKTSNLSGKKIKVYEGDICTVEVDFSSIDADKSNCRTLTGVIFYDEDVFQWFFSDVNNDYSFALYEYEFDVIEILGNWYQNPELLEATNGKK